ncbi:hypothetical protein HOLleu_01512 [Holothuria leucospilota]|uniref:Uncharacterized protein n=1 Tax=Holothuria leucospilota TaxID=206669 RepID=A0A9Q1CQJ1_HOLLE|nr:hypothetical protein HOLleu_01512 [Holothuria leucospilota]
MFCQKKKGVLEKVRLAMQNEEIKISEEDSVNQIFTMLDKWYKKDDLSVVCEAWCSFKNLTKKDTDTMNQFLNEYEKKVKALKKEGVAIYLDSLITEIYCSSYKGNRLPIVVYTDKSLHRTFTLRSRPMLHHWRVEDEQH